MNIETQNAVEENESVSFEVEEENSIEQTTEIPIVEKEETRTNVQEEKETEHDEYSDNVKKRINQLTAKRKQALECSIAIRTTAKIRK